MTLPRFAVTQCGCMDKEYQCSRKLRFRHYYLWFLQVALSHILPLRVQEVHIDCIKGITIHISESKIHISYSEKPWFDIIILLFLHATTSSPKGSNFSISSPFNIIKLQKFS